MLEILQFICEPVKKIQSEDLFSLGEMKPVGS